MKTLRFIPLVFAASVSVPLVFAQNTAAPATNPLVKPAVAATKTAAPETEGTVAGKTERPRAVSDEVSASILAGMPKYTPPAKKPEPKPVEELPDMREIDKPRNGIIRLPEHVVREKRPAVLQDRTVYTKEGLTDLALRRYITDADRALNRYNIFGARSLNGNSTTTRALAMYAEDERLKNMADLDDTARDIAKADPAGSVYIKRATQETYRRSSDFGWSGGRDHPDRGMNDAATSPH